MVREEKMQKIVILVLTIATAAPILASELEVAAEAEMPTCDSALAKKCIADIYAYQEVCSGLTTIAGFYSCVIAYASAQLDCYPCANMVFDFDAFMSCSTYNFHKCVDEIEVSWKDCHKSYSNPFDGGLQCVFEESSRYTGHCLHCICRAFPILGLLDLCPIPSLEEPSASKHDI